MFVRKTYLFNALTVLIAAAHLHYADGGISDLKNANNVIVKHFQIYLPNLFLT